MCLVLVCTSQDDCPVKCSCKRNTQRDAPDWVKLRCGDSEKVKSLEELDLTNIASEIVQLYASKNTMFKISFNFDFLQKFIKQFLD